MISVVIHGIIAADVYLARESNGFLKGARANAQNRERMRGGLSAHARKLVRMRESVRSRARANAHARIQIQNFEFAHAQMLARMRRSYCACF